MPTYEYLCKKCGHKFDEFQSITEPPVAKCPHCKSKAKRLISMGAGFLFKGSGFYETDYRSSDYKKKASEEKKSSEPKPLETKSKSEATKSNSVKSSKKDTAKDS